MLHGLHPDPLAVRVQRALDGVRPALGLHGGGVEIAAIDEAAGVVRLRLAGTCDGCPASAATAKNAIEAAVRELAPEVARVDVEGVVDPHAPALPSNGAAALAALGCAVEPSPRPHAGERCELCAAPIADEHAHVVALDTRALLCTCRACRLLFTQPGAALGKFRAVPERYVHEPRFSLGEAEWEALGIPVRMAFFFSNSALGRVVAFYPSPAGATESTLALDAWQALADANPLLETLEPDVEALLVHGRRGGGFDCFIVPIDACYELTGRVRRHWKGFDGGEEAWSEIDGFFARLDERSRAASELAS